MVQKQPKSHPRQFKYLRDLQKTVGAWKNDVGGRETAHMHMQPSIGTPAIMMLRRGIIGLIIGPPALPHTSHIVDHCHGCTEACAPSLNKNSSNFIEASHHE